MYRYISTPTTRSHTHTNTKTNTDTHRHQYTYTITITTHTHSQNRGVLILQRTQHTLSVEGLFCGCVFVSVCVPCMIALWSCVWIVEIFLLGGHNNICILLWSVYVWVYLCMYVCDCDCVCVLVSVCVLILPRQRSNSSRCYYCSVAFWRYSVCPRADGEGQLWHTHTLPEQRRTNITTDTTHTQCGGFVLRVCFCECVLCPL